MFFSRQQLEKEIKSRGYFICLDDHLTIFEKITNYNCNRHIFKDRFYSFTIVKYLLEVTVYVQNRYGEEKGSLL